MTGLTRARLLAWIGPLLGEEAEGLGDEDPLFSTGRLNSRRMLELVAYLERELGVRMRAADVRLDNLDSIARVLAWAARATGEREGAG